MRRQGTLLRTFLLAAMSALLLGLPGAAQDHSDTFDRDQCTFTSAGFNSYFPLLPGYSLEYEGEEEDEGETVEVSLELEITDETEVVDGVVTRVVVETEEEDDELVEISRNFMAICRETGDVWYFGEDVDDYEDGEIVGHGGQWRAGENGNRPGILMPAQPLLGARWFSEVAPGVAEDFAEVVSMNEAVTVPLGSYGDLLKFEEGSALDPEDFSEKWYAAGIGLVKDDALELVAINPAPCMPDATTHCLNDGRFKVQVDWEDASANEGDGNAILASADSGEFWFFGSDNTEVLVKVLDACGTASNSYWVFAAGLTDVELTVEVTDTATGQMKEYDNDLGQPFEPVLDTAAFATCP